MVLHGLNPLLRSRGLREGLHPRNVLGVSTLLVDSSDRLHKDNVLSRENPAYLTLQKRAISGLRLTGRVNFPAPVYSGKVAGKLVVPPLTLISEDRAFPISKAAWVAFRISRMPRPAITSTAQT